MRLISAPHIWLIIAAALIAGCSKPYLEGQADIFKECCVETSKKFGMNATIMEGTVTTMNGIEFLQCNCELEKEGKKYVWRVNYFSNEVPDSVQSEIGRGYFSDGFFKELHKVGTDYTTNLYWTITLPLEDTLRTQVYHFFLDECYYEKCW